jgi:hypothetical protein
MPGAGLNERQQQYLQAIYETDQEQEADERGMWKRGGTPRPARVIWRKICQGQAKTIWNFEQEKNEFLRSRQERYPHLLTFS